VPTILVADDNRNIHRMVVDALKEFGYKIETVGNGEYAVRKLPDLKPDLILADIFMPVRNGYEVCEFVKNNDQYAHIPVVLLQGQFDPLDEPKMRSVRADGLLMKPFVPPDPLIKMVNTLLEESAARAAAEALKKKAVSASSTVELTKDEVQQITGKPPEPEPEIAEYATAPPPVQISGDQPLAFGDLLGNSTATDTEQEPPKARDSEGFRASSMGDVEVEEEKEEAQEEAPPETPSWGGIEEELKKPSPDEPPIKVEFEPSAEPIELVRDESGAAAPSSVETGPLPELAASPDEWMSSSPPKMEVPAPPTEDWTAATEVPASVQTPPAPLHVEEVAPPRVELPVELGGEPEPAPAPAPEPAIETAPEPEPVDASPEPAIPAPHIETPQVEAPPVRTYEPPRIEEISAPVAAMDAVPAATPPAVSTEEPPAPVPAFSSAPESARVDSFAAPTVDPALVEAVVEKVLARLQPQLTEQIARDILRPLAEALIKKELEK
jgi:CheY-like chemotaxis protein